MIRKHYFFSGRVQGVGFRYKAYYTAQSFGLTGYVRNLYDGRVEMEVQGDEAGIDQMISKLRNDRYIEWEQLSVTKMEIDPEEHYFSVKDSRGY